MSGPIFSSGPVTVEVWVLTPNLRWRLGFLQQAWRDRFSGEIEWRDVPVVDTKGKEVKR